MRPLVVSDAQDRAGSSRECVSEDARRVASGGDNLDRSIRVWDAAAPFTHRTTPSPWTLTHRLRPTFDGGIAPHDTTRQRT